MNTSILIPLIIYLFIIFILAISSRRYFKADSSNFLSEYLLGGRSIGGFVLAMTLVATLAGASSFIGGPGAAYNLGLGWVLLAMIQVPVAWLTLGVLGKKFAIEARKHNALTLNDMLYARYKHRGVVIFASLALLLAFFGTMVVQFVGGARLLQTVTGLSYSQGLMIFTMTVGIYTTIGGFRAVVMTDTIQGLMMLIGTIALVVGVVHAGGGVGEMITELHRIDPGLVSPYGPNNYLSHSMMGSFWVLVCFGVIGLPHAALRCITYKDSQSMHRAIVIGTIMATLIMFGLHFSGALGRVLVPNLETGDQIMPTLMMEVLPPTLAGIFLAGPMAAMMSTIDSQLIQASATLLKDLYINYINPNIMQDKEQAQKKLPRLSLWVTGIFSVLVYIAAMNPPDMLIWLNMLAFGGMEAVFLWPLVLGLYWKRASATGALASMFIGLSSYALFAFTGTKIGDMHTIVPSLTLSLIVFIIGSYVRPTIESNETILEKNL